MRVPVPVLRVGQVCCLDTNDSGDPYTVEIVFSNPKILPAIVSISIGVGALRVGGGTPVKISGRDVSSIITIVLQPGQSVYALTNNRDIAVSLETVEVVQHSEVKRFAAEPASGPISETLNMQRAFETPDVGTSLSLDDPIYKAMAESFHLAQKVK